MSLQKRLASEILKCGERRIWIDPDSKRIGQAITRNDIRRLIKDGYIKKMPAKKHAKLTKKIQQRTGSKRGKWGVRTGRKEMWLKVVRPQRRLLKEIRPQLQPVAYRRLYRMVKGGAFRSKAHLQSYIKENNLMRESK